MTLTELFMWHREQSERFESLAENHKTTGATVHRDAVTRRNHKLAKFHSDAAALLKQASAHKPGRPSIHEKMSEGRKIVGARLERLEPLVRCAAARDGECFHSMCPQIRDGEPAKSGRHCPIDNWEDE